MSSAALKSQRLYLLTKISYCLVVTTIFGLELALCCFFFSTSYKVISRYQCTQVSFGLNVYIYSNLVSHFTPLRNPLCSALSHHLFISFAHSCPAATEAHLLPTNAHLTDVSSPDYVSSSKVPEWPDYIEIKDEEQIQGLRRAYQLARHILLLAGKSLKVGMTTDEIDFIVHQEVICHNAYPSTLHYGGFSKSVCTSVNHVVCRGIPDSQPLQVGDSIIIDVTVYLEGYHGDPSETFLIGSVNEHGRKLVDVARQCRDQAIPACGPGQPLCVIGNTISTIANSNEFCVCPYFIGHGIGTYFHGYPEIWHHGEKGMSFTIGSSEFKILRDKWTAVSVDDKRCMLCSILTKLPDED
uniref:Methionyl aminopeptidase type 1D (mitochondrial) n=1 Tax=Cyprinus carpio carpio TaxID=630221 RepID=A0A9J8AEL3_CYPCA